ncbi:hypothetical protein VTK26DRAFT_3401 [Humicola hyalothermophila]
MPYPVLPSLDHLGIVTRTNSVMEGDSEISSVNSYPPTPDSTSSQDFMNSWRFAPANAQNCRVDQQRLPPISDLLKDIPSPGVRSYARAPPTPIPSPIGFPSPLLPSPDPSWHEPLHRSNSLPDLRIFSAYLPAPRRPSSNSSFSSSFSSPASRSLSVPARPRLGRPSPILWSGGNHQHGSIASRRRLRGPKHHHLYEESDSGSDSDGHPPLGCHHPRRRSPPPYPRSLRTTMAMRGRRRPAPSALRTPAGVGEAQRKPAQPRRNNQPYTFEQEAFLIYHRVDL